MALNRSTLALAALAIAAACSNPVEPSKNIVQSHPAASVDSIYPLLYRPYGVAVSPSGDILVSRLDNLTVMHATIADFRFMDSVNVGNVPTDVTMTPSGMSAFVTNQWDFTVGAINVASLTQGSTLPVGTNAFRVKVNPAGTKLYATTAGDSMFVIDAASFSVLKRVGVGNESNGLAFSPSGDMLYVSSQDDADINVVQTSNDSVIAQIPAGAHPQEVAVSADGTELWVADEMQGVQVYGLPSGTLLTTLSGTAGAFGLAFSPDGEQVWVTMPSVGQIQVFTHSSRALLTSFAAGVPRRIAFDQSGAHAVITDEMEGVILFK